MTAALNLVCGPLGSGKTTLIQHLLTQKPAEEHWLLVVNEFGAVGIDGAILDGQRKTSVAQIPGGCICCTAKGEVEATLKKLLAQQQPDRILLEPTGLGEPDNLVDLIRFADFKDAIDIQAVITVFDAAHTETQDLQRMTIYQSLLNMADVVVLNKVDLAEPQQINPLRQACQACFPPKDTVFETQQGQIPLSAATRSHFVSPGLTFMQPSETALTHTPSQVKPHLPPAHTPKLPSVHPLPGLVERQSKQHGELQSIGWVFTPEVVFRWDRLRDQFQSLAAQSAVRRAKGVFAVGTSSRMLFQLAQGEITRELIAYRKDSRLELLVDSANMIDITALEKALSEAMQP